MNPQILIVDDGLLWSEYLTNFLKDRYVTAVANTLDYALSYIKTHASIKIVITDIALKSQKSYNDSFGSNIIARIRNERPDIKIILYSSFPAQDLQNAKDFGIDLMFSRSTILSDDLILGIESLLNFHKQQEKEKISKPDAINEARQLLMEEIEKYARIKERTLSIPEEGNFDLIKPIVGFKRDIEKQLSKFEYSKNVFLMMKFRESNKDMSNYIIETLASNGFNGVRADQPDWNITQNVYNPVAALLCCKFGIALFDEAEDHQAYNPNVAYELAIMHTHHKKCLILKHSSLPDIPFDLIKELYASYTKDLEVKRILTNWIHQIRLE